MVTQPSPVWLTLSDSGMRDDPTFVHSFGSFQQSSALFRKDRRYGTFNFDFHRLSTARTLLASHLLWRPSVEQWVVRGRSRTSTSCTMSHQSPRRSGAALKANSPAHKTARLQPNHSPRAAANPSPAQTSAVAPAQSDYRTSSHADSLVRRVQTDLPDDDYNVSTNAALASPVAAASTATPVKAASRVAPTGPSLPSPTSHNAAATNYSFPPAHSAPASTHPSALQPADPSTWEDDDAVVHCRTCNNRFTLFLRKHHCRQCGRIFCDNCSRARRKLRNSTTDELVRVCDGCERMLTVNDGSERVNNKQLIKPATPRQPSTAIEAMAAMSLAGEPMEGSTAAVSGGGTIDAVDCAPLIASLLVEVECAERLRRVHDRMRDEMDAMLRLLATELTAGGGKQAVEVDVVN